jgi:hypothetical protein
MILAKKNRILAVLMVAVAITGLTSCLKNNSNPQPDYYSMVFISNLATTPYKISAFFNDKDMTGGNGLEYSNAARGRVTPGPLKMDYKRLGSDTLLSTITTTLDTLYYYTFFTYGSQELGIKTYNFREDFTDINTTTKANIRFYNMSPGSEAVDFYVGNGTTTPVSSSRTYEDFQSGYYNTTIPVDPNTVEVIVKKAGTGEELARATNVTLNTGGVYSLVFIGTPGTTGNRKPSVVALNH